MLPQKKSSLSDKHKAQMIAEQKEKEAVEEMKAIAESEPSDLQESDTDEEEKVGEFKKAKKQK